MCRINLPLVQVNRISRNTEALRQVLVDVLPLPNPHSTPRVTGFANNPVVPAVVCAIPKRSFIHLPGCILRCYEAGEGKPPAR